MTGTVAVIGAGPGGLVAARWLLSQGFEPTIFEQDSELGGQWTGRPGQSGVWPAMYTNTSRVLTAFSDLEHEGDLVFLSNHDVLDYLNRYADMFGLRARIRFRAHGGPCRSRRYRVAGDVRRGERALRPSGGGHRQISVPGRPHGAGSRPHSPALRESSRHSITGEPNPMSASAFWWRAARSALWTSPRNSAQLGAAVWW